jgi:hypothetical protein
MEEDVPVASGGEFGESKASSPSVFILTVRLPRSRRASMKTHTSGTLRNPAMTTLTMTLRCASLKRSDSGSIEPVTITGFPRDSSMNESADAAYAIVSVPITTTKPSYCQ